jgi:hypothetical protein
LSLARAMPGTVNKAARIATANSRMDRRFIGPPFRDRPGGAGRRVVQGWDSNLSK